MIRVLTLSTLFPDATRPVFGGFVEQQTLRLAESEGTHVEIVAPIGIPPWPIALHPKYAGLRNLPEKETWKGLTVHRPRFQHVPASSGRFDASVLAKALLPKLREIQKSFPFQVIDAEFFFPDGPAAVVLGKQLGVPVSIKARGSDIHYWAHNPATARSIIAAGKQADGLLAVSEALKADMTALGMPRDAIKVHYTGVDLDRFFPLDRDKTKADLSVSGPLIVSVGALIPIKGQSLLIEALKDIEGATLVLIGKGPEESALRALAEEHDVVDRVIFTGSIAHEKIAEWLGAADVMALMSEREGLANAWVEALACGTPVVTTDVGGAREVIAQSRNGLLVERKAQDCARAITLLLQNPLDQDQVRATAENFTWARNTQALIEHLSNLRAV